MQKLVDLLSLDPKHVKKAEALVTQRFRELGILYQHLLYPIVMGLPNDRDLVIVETGVNVGISTYFMLKALEDREAAGLTGGVLYSCDQKFKSQIDAESKLSANQDGWPHFFGDNKRLFKRWKLFPMKSRDAFPHMPESWDMFLHDSDHSAENMTMELNEALMRCEPGAPIIIDDHAGDANVTGLHNAFDKWLKKQHLSPERVEFKKAAFFRLSGKDGVGTSPSAVATPVEKVEALDPAPALVRAPSEPPEVAVQVAVAASLGIADAAPVESDEDFEDDEDEDGVFGDDELDELEDHDKN